MQSEESRVSRDANGGLSVCLSSPIWVNTHTSVDSQTKSRVSDFGIAFRGDGDSGTPIVTGNNSRNPNPEGGVVKPGRVPRVSERNGMDGWMRGVTGYRDGRGEARRRTVPYRTVRFIIYVRFDYVDGTAGDWVRTYVHTHTVRGDGRKPREVVERSGSDESKRADERTCVRARRRKHRGRRTGETKGIISIGFVLGRVVYVG